MMSCIREVDLGLAAARNAVQKIRAESIARAQSRQGALLVFIQSWAIDGCCCKPFIEVRGARVKPGDIAFLKKRFRGAAPVGNLLGQPLGLRTGATGVQQTLEQFGLPGCAFCQRLDVCCFTELGDCHHFERRVHGPTLAQQRRQCGRHHFADRVVVVSAGKADELEIGGGQQRDVVDGLTGGTQLTVRQIGGVGVGQNHTDLAASTKGHPEPGPGGRQWPVRMGQVVEFT